MGTFLSLKKEWRVGLIKENPQTTKLNQETRESILISIVSIAKFMGIPLIDAGKYTGTPPNFKANTWKKENSSNGRANFAQNYQDPKDQDHVEAKFTKEQFSQLLALLDKHHSKAPSESAPSAHFAGKYCLASNNLDSWIIDSGASDHICFDLNLFLNHQPLLGKNHYIVVPDGRRFKVTYKGTVKLSIGLVLKDVLFVPDFSFNLLSVSKLVMDTNCRIFFTTNECFMQEA